MIPALLTVLTVLVIAALLYWVVHKLAATFGIPAQIVTVIDIILVVLVVIWLLQTLGMLGRTVLP
jgi:hypothetical protein